MNFKQKLGYMVIGCLFTILGFLIATLANNLPQDTYAQENGKEVIDEIVCKKIKVINRFGRTMVEIKGSDYGGGRITLHNGHGEAITLIQPAMYKVYGRPGMPDRNTEEGEELLSITPTRIAISGFRWDGKPAVSLGATLVEGVGYINVYGEKGKDLVSISAVKDRPNDGLINIYNYKGEWRSISKD